MSSKRKYLREQLAEGDISQARFTAAGDFQRKGQIKIAASEIPLDKEVFCPFCLKTNRLQRFLISGKKGISQSRAECPECHSGMLLRTVLKDWAPQSFAEWVFNYKGFFRKVDFEVWKKALSEKGWAQSFWDRYKQLKADKQEFGVSESENTHSESEIDEAYEAMCRNSEKEAAGSA